MSRHDVATGDGRWVYGWDQPLQSFFLHFHDARVDEDDNPVIWLGATEETTMYEVEDLVRVAKKNGLTINEMQQALLYAERDEGV